MPINAQILDNPKSDRVRRIADLTRAKGRERSGRFLIEGPQSVREAVTWRPDVVQDLYVEVSQALEHPRIISSTLEKKRLHSQFPYSGGKKGAIAVINLSRLQRGSHRHQFIPRGHNGYHRHGIYRYGLNSLT